MSKRSTHAALQYSRTLHVLKWLAIVFGIAAGAWIALVWVVAVAITVHCPFGLWLGLRIVCY